VTPISPRGGGAGDPQEGLPGVTPLLRAILSSHVYALARETALSRAPRLSSRLDAEVLLKREDQQPAFSFKIRGAHNCLASLSDGERARGVIAASAGNHAQGVAYSARHLGCPAVIVMPRTTPDIKVDSVRAAGAEVVLAGDHYAQAEEEAHRLGAARGLTFVHAYDDLRVIAGQATVAVEILRQHADRLGAIFVPVGGGGLIAGIGMYVKAVMPAVRVYGVQPLDSDAMFQSLAAGHPVALEHPGLFADGVAVRRVGRHTFPLVQATVDAVIRVSNDQICAAIKDVFEDTRSIVEPAGALAVAGLKAHLEGGGTRDGAQVAVLSGANMNFDRLRFVAERAALGEAREALFAVTIPERRGAFLEFCTALGSRIVTEFNYRLSGRERAEIFVGFAIRSHDDAAHVAATLRAGGYDVADLTENEVAKLHARHMVGGRARDVEHERLCRFEFPERPGALLQFLETLGGRWNISLFHYRNHGADFGRVLAGFEVREQELDAFHGFLEATGYWYQMEPANEAYRRFLVHHDGDAADQG
jgi:threonine dehydratase